MIGINDVFSGERPDYEELVSFTVYPNMLQVNQENAAEYLNTLCMQLNSQSKQLQAEYFWSGPSFPSFTAVVRGKHPHLKAIQRLGPNPEDLWYSLGIAMQLSSSHPDLIFSTVDSDGEYILIEAAEVLPKWLEPDNAANRLFIFNGTLRLISLQQLPRPSLTEALAFIRHHGDSCIAPASIKSAIDARIAKAKKQDFHHARLLIPATLSYALTQKPFIVSDLLTALDDAFESRQVGNASSALTSLCSLDGALNLTPTKVKFTQIGFAQLLAYNIQPSKSYPMAPEESPDHFPLLLGGRLSTAASFVISNETDKDSPNVEMLKELIKEAQEKGIVPVPYNGSGDSLDWLSTWASDATERDLERQMESLQLTEEEKNEIVEKMLNEEKTKYSGKLEELLDRINGYEGIDDGSDMSTDDDDYDEDEYSSDSGEDSFDSEEDEELLHNEIMEAIHGDPDLLMKIIEKGAELGFDTSDLVKAMQGFTPTAASSTATKKGVADIDPAKLSEARKASKVTVESDEQEHGDSDEEDYDDYMEEFGGTETKPEKDTKEPVMDDIDVDDEIYVAYTSQMDAELKQAGLETPRESLEDLMNVHSPIDANPLATRKSSLNGK